MLDEIYADYHLFILAIIGIAFLTWQVISLFKYRKFIVAGRLPSQKYVFPIVGLVFIVVFLNKFGITMESVTVMALYVAVFAFMVSLRSGITEKGIVVQGIMSPWRKIRYYLIDTTTANNPRVRFGLGFQEKFLEIDAQQTPLAEAYFSKYSLMSFAEYKDARQVQIKKQDELRANSKRNKDKKKK